VGTAFIFGGGTMDYLDKLQEAAEFSQGASQDFMYAARYNDKDKAIQGVRRAQVAVQSGTEAVRAMSDPVPPDPGPQPPPPPPPDPPSPGTSIAEPTELGLDDHEFIIEKVSAGSYKVLRERQVLYQGYDVWRVVVNDNPNYDPNKPPTVGIVNEAPELLLSVGHGLKAAYHRTSSGEYLPISILIEGLTEGATMGRVVYGDQYGPVDTMKLFDLDIQGLNGAPDCIGGIGRINWLGVHNCGFKPHPDALAAGAYGGGGLKWGMHHSQKINNFHWTNQRQLTMNGMPVRFQEHVGYPHAIGNAWICRNNLMGANRTGFQLRGNTSDPVHFGTSGGEVLVSHNVADGFAMDAWYDPAQPWLKGGGMVITVWTNPNGLTVVEENEIINVRYGALGVIAAPNSFVDGNGYAITRCIVRNNTFSQAPDRGDARETVQLGGGIGTLEIEGALDITRTDCVWDMSINADWAMDMGAPFNGQNIVRNRALDNLVVGTWDGTTHNLRTMTQEEKELLYV
jgi:hypothetical protein